MMAGSAAAARQILGLLMRARAQARPRARRRRPIFRRRAASAGQSSTRRRLIKEDGLARARTERACLQKCKVPAGCRR